MKKSNSASVLGFVRGLSPEVLETKSARQVMESAPSSYEKKLATWAAAVSAVRRENRINGEAHPPKADVQNSLTPTLSLSVEGVNLRVMEAVESELQKITDQVEKVRKAWKNQFSTPPTE